MRDPRLMRALLAGATGVVLAATLATPAGATSAAGATSTPSGSHQRVPAGSTAPETSAGLSPLATVPDATCPRGSRVTSVPLTDSFEAGLPQPEHTQGWGNPSAGAVDGVRVARSAFAGADPTPSTPDYHSLYPADVVLKPGTTTYLSFASRGSDEFDNIYFGAFDALYGDDLTADWTRLTVDVTAGIQPDGLLPLVFAQSQDDASATWWEIDDVSVITCGPVPATGVRGDWTADGKVDVLSTTGAGDLVVHPGLGTGGLGAGFAVGGGWAGMTYLGSPGDVNGDDRTDLIARSSDGTLYMYAGVGDGVFRKAVPIGQRWNGMTALITSGDVEGNGRPDLMARRNDGTLHLYQFSTTGALTYTRQLGAGWASMRWLVGVGDLDGDKRGDVLAINRLGDMYAYRGTATGLVGLGKVGSGWRDRTWVTSSGDLDGDGRGDVLARTADGNLYFYRGRGSGVAAGVLVGGGWNAAARIL